MYVLTNKGNKVLYIGVTNDLNRRMSEHKQGLIQGFADKYKLKKLIYVEKYPSIKEAITREKQLKNWHRNWKLNLICSINPNFDDLTNEMLK